MLFVRKETSEPILLLSMDHIITDFWSMTLLARELLVLYEGHKTGIEIIPAPAPCPLCGLRPLAGGDAGQPAGRELWEYWRDELSGELPALNLPADRPRRPLQTYRGDSRHCVHGQRTFRKTERARAQIREPRCS
jgi:hypothetical protein